MRYPFTLMRFEYGCTRFSGIRFSASFSRSRDQFLITATWRFLRFGAFLIAERRPRSNVIRSTRMTYSYHGVVTFYTRMPAASLRRYAVSSRIRAVYLRIYTVDSRIFTDIRGGFAFSTRVSRKHYTLITLSTVLIRCVDGSGSAEGRGNLRFGQPYRIAAVVVHFNADFFAVICRQQLKLDNTQ